MEFKELYLKRRTCRHYKDQEVKKEDLDLIMDAGMHAPVAMGAYDQVMFYNLKGEKLTHVLDVIKQVRGIDPSYGAKNLILVLHKEKHIALVNQDTGSIIENMCLMATDLGLGSVFSYSIGRLILETGDLFRYLEIPTDYSVLAGFFVGYRSEEETKVVKHEIKVIE